VAAKPEVAGNVLHVLHTSVDPFDFRIKRLGFWRRQQPALAAFKKRHAKPDFEMPDQPADARLRDVQEAGCVHGGAGQHHGSEDFDLAQIHGLTSRSLNNSMLYKS